MKVFIENANDYRHNGISITSIQQLIIDIVQELFGCLYCRDHFIELYRNCAFDACGAITSTSLQVSIGSILSSSLS